MANLINNYKTSDNAQTVSPTYGTDKQTGISKFKLSTIDTDKNVTTSVSLYGLLNELPEFSFEVDYIDGPAGVWQDTLSSFFRNDLSDLVNLIGADSETGYKNMVKAGTWSKKIYNGYKPGSIPLKFRIYTTDTLGQTDPNIWIDSLTRYATIRSSATYSIEQQMRNFFSGLKNISDTGKKFGNTIQGFANIYGSKPENDQPEQTQSEIDQNRVNEYDNKREQLFHIKSTILQCAKAFNAKPENKIPIDISFHTNMSTGQKITGVFTSTTENTLYVNVKLGSNELITGSDGDCGIDYTESADPDKVATKDSILEVLTNAKGKAQRFTESSAKIAKQDYESAYSKFLDEVKAAINALDNDEFNQDPDEETKKQTEQVNKLLGIINELGNTFIDKYGPYRVVSNFNKNNALGSKLWYLNIYDNIIFNSAYPLIVYISDWNVKVSNESISGTPVYYDFNITCHLDQVYSRSQWSRILAKNILSRENAFRRTSDPKFKSMQY